MNKQSHIANAKSTFITFIWDNRRNKTLLLLAAMSVLIQFAVFKYFYPFASFIHGDSFSYIETAEKNLDINTYMVGYSRFLRLFSVITTSDTALVAFQYLAIQASSLFLLFTIIYFYNPSKGAQTILLVLIVINPLYLHLGNLVSSDCLFAALSLSWFTVLLWIIHRPSKTALVWQTLILFIAFTFRYNALIYPLIAGLAFYLSPVSLRSKLTSMAVSLFLCGLFVLYTSYQYKRLTGYWQYSPFSGWQLTNNAMYAYRYITPNDRKQVPEKFKAFDNMVRQYFDSSRDIKKHPQEALMASTVYMWSPGLPMFKYQDSVFRKDSKAEELKKWATMGPFYAAYGLKIIKTYPVQYIKHFIWHNANKYYAPQVEFLQYYNSGSMKVVKNAKDWFKYKSQDVKTRFKSTKVWILDFYPILFGVANVILLFTLLCYLTIKGWKNNPVVTKGIIMGSVVWVLNAGFTICASSPALRFQSFPLLITILFMALLVDWLWNLAASKEITNNAQVIISTKEIDGNVLAS